MNNKEKSECCGAERIDCAIYCKGDKGGHCILCGKPFKPAEKKTKCKNCGGSGKWLDTGGKQHNCDNCSPKLEEKCCEKCRFFNFPRLSNDCKSTVCSCHSPKPDNKEECDVHTGKYTKNIKEGGIIRICGECSKKSFPSKPTESWEEEFDKRFTRIDLSPENRGYMRKWFLKDSIKSEEIIEFISSLLTKELGIQETWLVNRYENILKSQRQRLIEEIENNPEWGSDDIINRLNNKK